MYDGQLASKVYDAQTHLFEWMAEQGFNQRSGHNALRDQGEVDLADAWFNWYADGDDS